MTVSGDDEDLRALLSILDPKARDDLRRAPDRDRADRDAISRAGLRPSSSTHQDAQERIRVPGEWNPRTAKVHGSPVS
jgi:hypothetical protein